MAIVLLVLKFSLSLTALELARRLEVTERTDADEVLDDALIAANALSTLVERQDTRRPYVEEILKKIPVEMMKLTFPPENISRDHKILELRGALAAESLLHQPPPLPHVEPLEPEDSEGPLAHPGRVVALRTWLRKSRSHFPAKHP